MLRFARSRRQAAPGHRARHDEVRLVVRSQPEHVVADRRESPSLIERDGTRVALPHTEPERPVARGAGCGETRAHERRTDAVTKGAAVDIESLQLDRTRSGHARFRRASAKLGVPVRPRGVVGEREQERVRAVGKLGPDAVERERGVDVGLHVVGRVDGGERVAERPLGERRQRDGVGGGGATDAGRGERHRRARWPRRRDGTRERARPRFMSMEVPGTRWRRPATRRWSGRRRTPRTSRPHPARSTRTSVGRGRSPATKRTGRRE